MRIPLMSVVEYMFYSGGGYVNTVGSVAEVAKTLGLHPATVLNAVVRALEDELRGDTESSA